MGNPGLWGPSGGNLAAISLRGFFFGTDCGLSEDIARATLTISDADPFK